MSRSLFRPHVLTVGVVAAPAPPFDPSSLPGLEVWLKADTIVGLSELDPVTNWPDESGNGRDAVTFGAAPNPIYRESDSLSGMPGVDFTSSANAALSGPLPLGGIPVTGGHTYYVCWRQATVGATSGCIYADTTGARPMLIVDDAIGAWGPGSVNNGVGWRDATGVGEYTPAVVGQQTMVWVFPGNGSGTGLLYREGILRLSDGWAFPGPDTSYRIGNSYNANGASCRGVVYEFLFYSEAHDDATREQVQDYLSARW